MVIRMNDLRAAGANEPSRQLLVAAPRPDHRIDDIECLRAYAILVTLVAHSPALFGGTWLVSSGYFDGSAGVDLFFVISGYVVTLSRAHDHRLHPDLQPGGRT